ncbi:FAD-dependent oxidoreductase domain-containing protein 1 [Ciona intestinalis]
MLPLRLNCLCKHSATLLRRLKQKSPKYLQISRTYKELATISQFQDHEVYSWHRPDPDMRDGPIVCPGNEADYLILGGGIMGQALAFNIWKAMETTTVLKASKHYGCKIVVVEQDPSLLESSTALSAGGIRTQFSNPANIQLSMLTAEFIRDIKVHLSTVDNQDPDAQYNPQGYLTMATQSGASRLMKNYQTQVETGAKIMLFTQDHLKETFPWINVEGIELATYGLENEGWFDPMMYVNSFKAKNPTLNIHNVKGKVVGFKNIRSDPAYLPNIVVMADGKEVIQDEKIEGVYIKMPEHEKPIFVKSGTTVICCGAMSGEVARLAGVGEGSPEDGKYLEYELPVERRKRYVYVVHCPDAPMFDFPFLVDPSGAYARRDGFGGKYICGMSPNEENEPDISNLDVDCNFFDEEVWPRLAHRIPAFEKLKMTSSWAGYYDYNTYDQNGVIGPHPYHLNLYFLTGFSGHGLQQSYGATKALADLIVNGETDIDIAPFSFNRFISNQPLLETNII